MFKSFLKQRSFSEYKFKSDIFPTVDDRVFWNEFQNEECIKEAEAELNYSWPAVKATDFMEFKKSGNRAVMEDLHFDRRNHLILFVLAELKENKGRFLPQIVNGLFAICEETYWGLSAHMPNMYYSNEDIPMPYEPYIDLFAAETAEHLAVITHILKAPLLEFCPQILERVAFETEKRIKEPYITHRDWWWMGYHQRCNNWNPWILSNVLTVFLLTESNERRLNQALEKMFTEIQFYYDALPSDGGCDEGPVYWGRAGFSLFDFIYQLKIATDGKLDLLGDEKLARIAAYLKKVHIVSDYFVNVADAHASGQAGLMILLFGFARETKQKDLINFSAAVFKEAKAKPFVSHTLRNMRLSIFCSEFLKELLAYPVSYPLHTAVEILPDMELAVLRKGNMTLSAKGGFNEESHNHNDVGSFTLYDGLTPVLIDVGINTYTRFTFSDKRYTLIPWTRSSYHNLPLVNGAEQPFGSQFRADSFFADEGKIAVSYGGAYPSEAGLKTLTRDLTLSENGMNCVDRFSFVSKDRRQVTEVLMSLLPVRVEDGAAILGESYRVEANCKTIEVEYIPFDDSCLESDWKTKGVTRILLTADNVDHVTLTVRKIK